MNFLERDLEEIIMNASQKQLRERGLNVSNHKRNQVRIGNYGIADIVTYEKGIYYSPLDGRVVSVELPTIAIYELKKDKVSLSSFAQVCNYAKGIQDYFIKRGYSLYDYNWRVILIGKEVDKDSSLCYFPDLFTMNDSSSLSVEMYEYKYDVDGIKFQEITNYSLKNKGF